MVRRTLDTPKLVNLVFIILGDQPKDKVLQNAKVNCMPCKNLHYEILDMHYMVPKLNAQM
jgi:hypothetical protein